jgi:PAS domain-containing protein
VTGALADSSGIATFDAVKAADTQMPIMILSAMEEEALAIEAVERTAQGYLSKGYFKSYIVPQGLRNIIQRKSVEVARYREKARAEITLNSIADAVIGNDVDGIVDYLNIAAETITGWTREAAFGQPITNIFRIINGLTGQIERGTVNLVLQYQQPIGLPPNTKLNAARR